MNIDAVQKTDPELAQAIVRELGRQRNKLELIASENFTSLAVMQACGTVLTNKYAEGLPGKRYYGGCEYVDVAEELARQRACALFDAQHANVQPHSGAQANMAVFLAYLKPGDTVMGMNLAHGGHLTHGSPVNFSGLFYKIIPYGVSQKTETIDYAELARLASEHKPKMIVAGASAYPRVIDFARFREIADSVGALLMTDMAHFAGLVAAGEHPSPVPYSHVTTTTTHKTLRGPRGGLILTSAERAKDIDKSVFPGIQGGPLMHIIAGKAVALKEAQQPEFKSYQRQVRQNAVAMADEFMRQGVRIVSGGTDNHLMLLDLRPNGLTGKQVEAVLDEVNITVNKNGIPFDTQSPFVTSGIRIGTPAMTTRGMKENEMRAIARCIADLLKGIDDHSVRESIKSRVKELTSAFPLYPEIKEVADVLA